ncbi:MAG: hypothetical protein COB15_14845 [Flavobacteriales bacterium]|nr:MAG: hypothetical protein COB15_14845 [Flavobacteriales bacterium]
MKTLLPLLLVITLSNVTIAQTTAIPDANFEQALINLGYDSGPINGSVVTANIVNVQNLYLGNEGITNFYGIQDFTALSTFNCENQSVLLFNSLDLSQNTMLTTLTCKNNGALNNLILPSSTILTYFDCSGTKIQNFNYTQIPNLIYLDCTATNSDSLNVSGNTVLETLYCGANNLTSLDLSQNTALIDMHCTSNNLDSLDLSQNINLVTLDCSNTQLTSLNITQNINLIELFCALNQLTNIDITQNTLLSLIKCWDNLLTNIDVTQNPNLIYIACDNNQLTSLDVSQNLSLQRLRCDNNQITGGLNLSQHTSLKNLECQNNLFYSLNIKNGINNLFFFFDARNNPSLTCVEVDDSTWSATNWSTKIDGIASFSTNCNYPCILTETDSRTECNSLTWIDGITYTSSNNTAKDTILTSNGCDSIVTLDLTISNLDANYSFTDNGNGNYSFTNSSGGSFNQSHWAFGDGSTSTTTSPSHTFGANGTFIVALTINDSNTTSACTDYYLDTIIVTGVTNPVTCASGFVMYPDTATGDVTVINSSTGSNLTYLWDFGDGTPTSSLQNPTHTYTTSGPFYLCLTVNDGSGCIDTYCDSIGENGVVFKTGGFTINVIGTPIITGIDNNIDLNTEIEIYPNPTSNQLSIDTELNISEVRIVDITGKTIITIKQKTKTINVAELVNGIYFIKVIADEKTITKKFVKQ